MDIEERADKYAREHYVRFAGLYALEFIERDALRQLVRDAYLAGSAQTQADYVAHYHGFGYV